MSTRSTPALDAALLSQLRTFEIVAQRLSFTKAAQALNITQSAVSQQVSQLEARLDYPLLLRRRGALTLTSKGTLLFECLTRSFLDIERTLKRLTSAETSLHVNCPPTLALQWLVPRLADFHRAQPRITARLKAEYHLLDRQTMYAEGIDVAVRFDPLQYDDVNAEPILDEYLVPVATRGYLARYPAFSAGESMEGVTLLHDTEPWVGAPEFVEWRTWMQARRPEWLDKLDGPQFNITILGIGAALNHQGVAMARSALVLDEIASGRLVPVFPLAVPAPGRYVMLTVQPDDPGVSTFSQWLKEECEQLAQQRRSLLAC